MQCIFIGSRQLLSKLPVNTTISIDKEIIIASSHLKNLGLHMDKNMIFDKQVSEVTKKVTETLMCINRNNSTFDKTSRIIIVQTLALSIMNYCLRIWGTKNKTIMSDAQKMYNFAAKVAIGGEKKKTVTPIYKNVVGLNSRKSMY